MLVLIACFTPPASARPPRQHKVKVAGLAFRHIKRVVLDPGHGGTNQGAVAVTGAREKAVTLAIALQVASRLRSKTNVEVILTRDSDEDIGLRNRTRLANAHRGDVFISIHGNSSADTSIEGVEVYFLAADSADSETARLIDREEGVPDGADRKGVPWSLESVLTDLDYAWVQALSERLASNLAGAFAVHLTPRPKVRGVRQAPFGVLKEARMPAVVLEVGYLTHPVEGRALLDEGRQTQLARAVILALAAFDRDMGRARSPQSARPHKAKGAVRQARR